MTTDILKRHIDLQVAFNVRHLGGYTAEGRRRTRHTIIRSASLHRLTDGGADGLCASGVTTIIDLRSTVEREREVTPDLSAKGVTNLHLPVFESDASPSGLGDAFPGFGPIYERFLEQGATAYRGMAEAIESSDGGVLFHCAAGKDRTGVAAALLLDLAGVDHETIVEDYVLSAELLATERPKWLENMKERGLSPQLGEQLLGAEASSMEHLLDVLKRQWGGAAAYLRKQGMPASRIERLQDRIVE